MDPELALKLSDPLRFGKILWPNVEFYRKQREVIYSVRENDETVVPAGNQLGKDFVAGFIALTCFLKPDLYFPGSTGHEVRVVTTSVKDDHLRVLWGEIGRYIDKSRLALPYQKGGPLIVNHHEIRKIVRGERDAISYLIGTVSERGEGLQGHHAKHTLFIIDEASGVENTVYTMGLTWAKKVLIIGNPNPVPQAHFFYKAVKGGDILANEVTNGATNGARPN